eukprot:TRINITY_DN11061_c0_g1_i1.p1 TRINITY_DN11061_c0_g1~~TRINITY_DN11061_c0_g1_i1.p1  ORF type:complete len:379 (+),score=139.78 TRINITY_DN11061_c0_g1_i1:70-1206(+)
MNKPRIRQDRTLLLVAASVAFFGLVILLKHDSGSCPSTKEESASKFPAQSHFPLMFFNRKEESVFGNIPATINVIEMNVTTNYLENGKTRLMNLFLMGSNTNPPFVATLAHPKLEAASADVYENDDMEVPTRHMFEYLLNYECKKTRNGKLPVVVDAGANLGYFATYAAVMGCQVVAFEPQPRLVPIITMSTQVNGLTQRFKLINRIISDTDQDKLKIRYAKGMCWGCSVVQKAEPGDVSNDMTHIIESTRIDMHVNSDVLLMKVDVEGFEVIAIESAQNVFDNYVVSNLLIEWSPKRWPHGLDRGTKLLEKLYDMGYVIRHYDLRMHLPKEYCEAPEELDPLTHRTWVVKREYLGAMNEFLKNKDNYGEANIWISKK